MSRVSLRDRQALPPQRGRAALFPPGTVTGEEASGEARAAQRSGGPLTEDGRRSTDDSRRCASEKRSDGQSWEETHRRVTFYCPVDLLSCIEGEVARGQGSKSQIIVGALITELAVLPPEVVDQLDG